MVEGGARARVTRTTLSWLHISDIHLREKTAWAQDVVLTSLLKDVTERYGKAETDLIFVTGDIAFSGKHQEYVFAEDFLRKLTVAVSLQPDQLFVVPGNHDIDRDKEEDAFTGVRAKLRTSTEVDRFFDTEGRRKTLFSRQAEFRAFANRLVGGAGPTYTDSSYAHARLCSVGSIRVRVLLLDSAWFSEGGDTEIGQLLIGERQVIDTCKVGSPDGETLTFALVHHPFSWLQDFEQVAVENDVVAHAHLCLRGHVHVPDTRATEALQRRLPVFTAGAAFETRTTENSYVRCTLDLATGSGTKTIHRYIHHDKRWQASEPEPWSLVSAPPVADAVTALSLVLPICVTHPHYISCLLAALVGDVPIALGSGAFVNVSAVIPGQTNDVGALVMKLRHHLHWRHVWDGAAWQVTFAEFLRSLDSLLTRFTGVAAELQQRESQATQLLDALAPTAELEPLRNEIDGLLDLGDVGRARSVLERWRSQVFLRANDRLELSRLEVKIFLAEGHHDEALSLCETLIADPNPQPPDVVLAAVCAHRCGDHTRAASRMHEALDAGAEPASTVVYMIAGASGDKRLVKRVRK